LLIGGPLRSREGGRRPSFDLVLVNGLGQFTINYAIVYWAQQTLPSGLVAILWAVFPLMVAALAHWMLPGERVTLRQWVGFCVAFVGVAILFSTDVAAISVDAVPTGLVVLIAPAIVAFVTIYLKRHGREVSSILLARDSMGLGAVLLWSFALVTERDVPVVWSASAIGAICYLALIGSCLTFGVYLWLLRWVEAYKLSLISYVAPMIALLVGGLVDDEPIRTSTIVGSGVILLGVAAASKRRR
ncbi:MAG: EamA family transporter, partial [Planctomycetes bacterium]|nr:EamA family transporter [Planctomycetota bacterium]